MSSVGSLGDFNGDELFTATDIDMLSAEILEGTTVGLSGTVGELRCDAGRQHVVMHFSFSSQPANSKKMSYILDRQYVSLI